MLIRRLSSLVFAALSCWILLGCFGGQGGDEGLDPDEQDAGSGGSAGSGGVDVTVGTGGTDAPVGVGGAPASGDPTTGGITENPIQPTPGTASNVPGYGCAVEVWRSPETELESYYCSISSSDPYAGGSQGEPGADSEPRQWQCDCDGVSQTVEASECDQALENGCGVTQEDRGTFCRNELGAIGVCWNIGGADWQCGCGDPADRIALVEQYDQSCDDALFHVCAQPCEGLLGECTPRRDSDEVGYQCDCTYYGEIARVNGVTSCQRALEDACHPNHSNVGDSCNGYVGYCDTNELGYDCHCLDGIEESITSVDMSDIGCYTALEQVCGENQPPEDSICEVETSDESSIGQGYCVQIDEDLYECACRVQTTGTTMPPPGATPSTDGSGGIITPPVTLTEPVAPPPNQQNELRIAASCDQALVMACPDLIQATPEQKSEACEMAYNCYPTVVQNACLERIRDDCAICIIDAIDSGAPCGDERIVNCVNRCVNLSDPPAEPEACKSRLDFIDVRDTSTECLCNRCLESIAPCGVDVGCVEITLCAREYDCVGMDCFTPDTCQDVINKWMAGDSVVMAQALGDCGVAQGCL